MKAELLNQEVLAMYDVRGIQNYIFKSNAAKEIIGASALVEKIITDGLQEYVKGLSQDEQPHYMMNWSADDPEAFLKAGSDVEMQILFVGGGNAYVLFRTGEVCQKVNRFLSRYILDHTYSLSLAVAVVGKTENYQNDYNRINQEMAGVKARMPMTVPAGALPFMAADSVTGYPLTGKEKDDYCSTEAALKRAAFPKEEDEKIFDNMVTEKGDSSTLAVVHMDGNSMGRRIQKEMQSVTDYTAAVKKMRKLSGDIAAAFRNTVDRMKEYMNQISSLVKKDLSHKLYREIIVAGDDITFVCNAKLAIPAVRYFLSHIGDAKENRFSACGGIAFFNSHFPFSDAYQVAEACCENAKKRAKQPENRGTGEKIGNFFDFQICTNIHAATLEGYRDRQYTAGGRSFIARPYYVPLTDDTFALNQKNEKYSVEQLIKWQHYFCNEMPRSKAKELRDAVPKGFGEVEKEISFLQSRGYSKMDYPEKNCKIWYDALEIMDWFIDEKSIEGTGGTCK